MEAGGGGGTSWLPQVHIAVPLDQASLVSLTTQTTINFAARSIFNNYTVSSAISPPFISIGAKLGLYVRDMAQERLHWDTKSQVCSKVSWLMSKYVTVILVQSEDICKRRRCEAQIASLLSSWDVNHTRVISIGCGCNLAGQSSPKLKSVQNYIAI